MVLFLVAIEKFARYFDVECRLVPVDASTNYCMDPKRAMDYVDENTIGIYVILGSTCKIYFLSLAVFRLTAIPQTLVTTRTFRRWRTCSTLTRPRRAFSSRSMSTRKYSFSLYLRVFLITKYKNRASGGFVAPFATPSLKWDFEIPRVVSINTSGHKVRPRSPRTAFSG